MLCDVNKENYMKTTLNGLYGRKKTKQEKKSIKIKIFSYPIYKLTALFPKDIEATDIELYS